MGETNEGALKLHFDGRVRLEFQGATISSDAGLLAYREMDEALQLTAVAPVYLQETRTDGMCKLSEIWFSGRGGRAESLSQKVFRPGDVA